MTLQLCHQILRQIGQTPSKQGFHNHSRDAPLLQLGIEIAGINIVLTDLIGIVPVEIVQLYLYKVPVVLVMQRNDLIEHRLFAVERETEVTDTTRLALLHQIVHNAIIDVTAIEFVHSAANSVQQVIVEIVHLQFLQRVLIHLNGFLPLPIIAVEVGEFRGYEIFVTRMTL